MAKFREDLFRQLIAPYDSGACYALMSLSDLAYANKTEYLEAYRQWAGFETANYVPGTYAGDPRFAILKHPRGCVFAFSGTESFPQFLRQLVFAGQTPNHYLGHTHLSRTYHWWFVNLRPLIVSALEGVDPDTPITFTGHSLGGVMALLSAVYLHYLGGHKVAHVVGFGCPKAGARDFFDYARPVMQTWVRNEHDLVPVFPPHFLPHTNYWADRAVAVVYGASYSQLGRQFVLDVDGEWQYRHENFWEHFFPTVRQTLNVWDVAENADVRAGWSLLHSPHTYKTRLRNVLARRGTPDNVGPLDALNQRVFSDPDLYDHETPVYFRGGPLPILAFADPEQAMPTDPAPVPPDPPEAIQVDSLAISVDVISGEGDLGNRNANVQIAGPPLRGADLRADLFVNQALRRNWMFKGRDRRLLEKLAGALAAIQARDAALLGSAGRDGRRVPVFDPADSALAGAAALLHSAIGELLARYVE